MRSLSPIVASTLVLFGLVAGQAFADPSIVADLDSNATNGPDTLQAEVGDTVLVRVWITDSADSLVSFGITLGDTTGALAWIEEDAESVYTTPTGWVAIPVQEDAAGRLLLQGADFAHANPLRIPRQVAELQFVVGGDSCATITWDSTMSGWMDWGFTEGTFASFEGAVICVEGQEDGGDEDGQDGEGGVPPEDDSTTPFAVRGVTSYPPPDRDVAEGMIIVQFRKGVFVPDELTAREGDLSDVVIREPRVRAALDSAGVESWARLAWPVSSPVSPANPVLATRSGTTISYESKARTFVLHAGPGVSVTDMLRRISTIDDAYVYAEPLVGGEDFGFPSVPDTTPSDSLYVLGEQSWAEPIDTSGYPLRYGIDAPGAWKRTTGNPAIKLGIVDSGIRRFHPDFVTYPDSQLVYEFYDTCWPEDSLEPWASDGHGTSVLGIAAGLTHNKRDPDDTMCIGTAGLAGGVGSEAATMVRTRMYKYSGTGECAAPHGMIVALDQGIADGMDIMNFSNGAYGLAYAEALARGYQAGIAIVAAMGRRQDGPSYRPLPAASQTNRTLAVGNGRITGERYTSPIWGSPFGRWNDVMAPGDEAMAPTWEAPWWGPFGGTSAASPMVAGTCALLASRLLDTGGDHAIHEELEALITAGAVESRADTIPGHDVYYGYGFLNARNSIRYLDSDRFVRGRFTATGLDGDTVSFQGAKLVILGTAGEDVPVVSPEGDTLVDGEYPYAEVYKATRTVLLPSQYTGDSVVVAGIGHGLPSEYPGSSGWASGDSLPFSVSGTDVFKAVLFRDRYCEAAFLPPDEIRLTSYFWRFPLSVTDTVWAPFDPSDAESEIRWAYTVFGKAASTSVPERTGRTAPVALQGFGTAPNPFNPTVDVHYRLGSLTCVEISVFDVVGRHVRTLKEGIEVPGEHSVMWDGRDDSGRVMGSGTYFARIRAGDGYDTAKITLVR